MRASACCAARPAGFPAPSCRRTGGCSGTCARPAPAARPDNPACARAGTARRRVRADAAVAALGEGSSSSHSAASPNCKRDAAFGRLVEAGDAVEHGGLAGAVRADQRGDVAARGREREVVDGDEAAEAHGQMVDPQDGCAESRVIRGPPARARRRSACAP